MVGERIQDYIKQKRAKFKGQGVSTMSLGSLKLLRKSRLAQAVLAHGRPKSAWYVLSHTGPEPRSGSKLVHAHIT